MAPLSGNGLAELSETSARVNELNATLAQMNTNIQMCTNYNMPALKAKLEVLKPHMEAAIEELIDHRDALQDIHNQP